MSNGAMFPPRGHAAATKNKTWRKVINSEEVVRRRDSLTSDEVAVIKVWRLTLVCKHVVYRSMATLAPPDRVVCKTCVKEGAK